MYKKNDVVRVVFSKPDLPYRVGEKFTVRHDQMGSGLGGNIYGDKGVMFGDYVRPAESPGELGSIYASANPWGNKLLTELVIKKEKSMSLSKKLKELTRSKEDKLLIKHGVIEECGELTCDGQEVLFDLLFKKHKAEVIALVEKLDAEQSKKTKK